MPSPLAKLVKEIKSFTPSLKTILVSDNVKTMADQADAITEQIESVTAEQSASSGSGSMILVIAAVSVLAVAVFREMYRSVKKPPPPTTEESVAVTEADAASSIPVTESELRQATGGEGRALYVAVKDPFSDDVTVFDVSTGSDFYGPGGPYHVFAGKNATYGLATSSTDPDKTTGDLSLLTGAEQDTHMQWYAKYSSKYPIVGKLVPDAANTDTSAVASAKTSEDSEATAESKKDQ